MRDGKVIEVLDYLRYFPDTYAKDTNEGLIELLRAMASGIYFDGMFKVRIDWIKPFSFMLDPKVMEQVNNLSENNRRREIPHLEKFKSCSAGNQGRFSNSVIDEILLEFMICIAQKELDSNN